jgi:hypothetical protein
MTFAYTGGVFPFGTSAAPSTGVHGITINSGDLVCIYINSNSTTSVTHGGGEGTAFTSAVNEIPSGETARSAFFWKVAGGSEPTSYTFASGNAQWQCILKVFTSASAAVVDAAANTVKGVTDRSTLETEAADGEVISDNALSVIVGAKDSRWDAPADLYNTVDNSYVSCIGTTDTQKSAMAHRIYTTGTTFSGNIILRTSDGNDGGTNEPTYGVHISFLEGATNTDILVPTGPWR